MKKLSTDRLWRDSGIETISGITEESVKQYSRDKSAAIFGHVSIYFYYLGREFHKRCLERGLDPIEAFNTIYPAIHYSKSQVGGDVVAKKEPSGVIRFYIGEVQFPFALLDLIHGLTSADRATRAILRDAPISVILKFVGIAKDSMVWVDEAEISTSTFAKKIAEKYSHSAKKGHEASVKGRAKNWVHECWQDWEAGKTHYRSKAAFAKDMMQKQECLTNPAVITKWCSEWKKIELTQNELNCLSGC
jgi:hypothetical protein